MKDKLKEVRWLIGTLVFLGIVFVYAIYLKPWLIEVLGIEPSIFSTGVY